MSLKFGGSFTPERPIVFSPTDYGDGTIYPISFTRYPGSTSADDDICKCQWRLNKVKIECEGSVTIRFYDPASILAPPSDQTVSFTLSDEGTATVTGADCSVRLPTNIASGDNTSVTGIDNDIIPVTLPWGAGTIHVTTTFAVGSPFSLGITDTTFTEYWKAIRLQFSAFGAQASGNVGQIEVSTFNDAGWSAFGSDADVFHDTAPLYSAVSPNPGDASVTFTKFKLTATDYLAVP